MVSHNTRWHSGDIASIYRVTQVYLYGSFSPLSLSLSLSLCLLSFSHFLCSSFFFYTSPEQYRQFFRPQNQESETKIRKYDTKDKKSQSRWQKLTTSLFTIRDWTISQINEGLGHRIIIIMIIIRGILWEWYQACALLIHYS